MSGSRVLDLGCGTPYTLEGLILFVTPLKPEGASVEIPQITTGISFELLTIFSLLRITMVGGWEGEVYCRVRIGYKNTVFCFG